METFAEDQENIHKMLKLPFKAKAKNARKSDDGLSTRDLTNQYFKDVPPEKRRKLEDIYALDFELFEYNPNLY